MSDKEHDAAPSSTELAPAAPEPTKALTAREKRELEHRRNVEYCQGAILREMEKAHRIVEGAFEEDSVESEIPFNEMSARTRMAFELAKLDHTAARTAKHTTTNNVDLKILVLPEPCKTNAEWEVLARGVEEGRTIDVEAEEVGDADEG